MGIARHYWRNQLKQLTEGERIARDLCESEPPIDNIIEVDPADVARRIDVSFAELRQQLKAVKEDRNNWKEVAREKHLDAISWAERHQEVIEQLATAEQRVAEAMLDALREEIKTSDGVGLNTAGMRIALARLERGEYRKFMNGE